MNQPDDGLYIVLISLHGLIRGHELELGRDADTGGQTKYAIELARALAENPQVGRVDLLTRKVIDPKVGQDYSEPLEYLAPRAQIVRLSCGPRRYLRKEVLWPYLGSFADYALQHIRRIGRLPDIIHSHYADAAYVGVRLAGLLGVPLVHTGHSLGRVKRHRLLEGGTKEESIETRYNMRQRIEAEEQVLSTAALVVASTQQEVDEQYALYDNYHPKRMVVIPPGTDLERFHPPSRFWRNAPIEQEINRFLSYPRKPLILALSRPDARKNISTLIRAYGENPALRQKVNLVLIVGNRDDIGTMEKGPRTVLKEILLLIDRYDLYGSIAYPKHHEVDDVPDLYRLAARSKGVFINPALTEPFGLTLIEAAASGLPVIATHDGGPREILEHCKNGCLIDPLDADRMGKVLLESLSDRNRWHRWAKNGLKGAQQYYSWPGHVTQYLREVSKVIRKAKKPRLQAKKKSRLPISEKVLVCDIDNTLTGDGEGLRSLFESLKEAGAKIGFGIATGRNFASTLKVLKKWDIPLPDLLITGVGSQIFYGPNLVEDQSWQQHIRYRWKRESILKAMADIPNLRLQPSSEQLPCKISYDVDVKKGLDIPAIARHLRQLDLSANIIYSYQAYLDLLPVRASKGSAVRFFCDKWGIPLEHLLVVGDSGSDKEMLSGNTLGAVVGNYSPELEYLREDSSIYFAQGHHAWGILEALAHYGFLEQEKAVVAKEEAL
ncbi:HAD-superfamily hydrolase subfamily IIB [Nitrosococcus oceani ATCC 19707]|uniref:sucrose-phosphate synthase n=2 Tax=Nitrosococcus oceani TaxID=1229 RepID=Q3J6N6_NITOC|nr:HAD-IIB family hydrolase [Nitrosococcus oceani]ABA59510.1 HAD-superfamily hydrolase subfamily IIB [Nitrosococcus oceani ATCC 19707]EDZ65828.1 HAD-superfamily hydrolase, subfamily IIB, putative [Nitrosococcus oceani AFC27]KFI18076.1 HAD family hydrolase [Nitrosococcus oceani C-27]GEM21363.1 haloacid dehalogenase [Nitrosococcus oceani]